MASANWARRAVAVACVSFTTGIMLAAASNGLVTAASARGMGGGGSMGFHGGHFSGFHGSRGFRGAQFSRFHGFHDFRGAQFSRFHGFHDFRGAHFRRFHAFRNFNNRNDQLGFIPWGWGGGWGDFGCSDLTWPCEGNWWAGAADPRNSADPASDPPPPSLSRYEPPTVETTPFGVTIIRGPGSHRP